MTQLIKMAVLSACIGAAAFAGDATYEDVAYFRLEVNPTAGNGNYEVIAEPGFGAHHIYCWAGNYAQAYLRAPANTRIYVKTPLGPSQTRPGKKAVEFTIDPTPDVLEQSTRPGDNGNYSVSVKKVGYNLSIGHTRNFCDLDLR